MVDRAIAVLREDPLVFLTAAEIGRRATGHVLGRDDTKRYDRACLNLVDHEMAWPQNLPDEPRCYRLRELNS